MTGFEQADTETLLIIRGNLLRGLEKVAATIADGTFETVGPKGAAPPSQSGQTTLALLTGIEAELESRRTKTTTPPTSHMEELCPTPKVPRSSVTTSILLVVTTVQAGRRG